MSQKPANASRQVLIATADALNRGEPAALALVLDTEGSTYVGPGAMALFGGVAGQVGWLSGGCLESEIAQVARRAVEQRRIEWMDIDTRDDGSLLSGSATGCRGRLHLALIPLTGLDGLSALIAHWQQAVVPLSLTAAVPLPTAVLLMPPPPAGTSATGATRTRPGPVGGSPYAVCSVCSTCSVRRAPAVSPSTQS